VTVSVYFENRAGRKGVPLRASFAAWIAAIPDLRRHRNAQVNLLVVGTRAGRRFNRQFRGKDYATNVLGFPYDPLPGEKTALLGELIMCAPVVAREAAEQGKRLRDHYAHLAIHGVLHLLGYDHDTAAAARTMEGLERRVLAGLGISDPYS
jgi:probable rRNA maturation factor